VDRLAVDAAASTASIGSSAWLVVAATVALTIGVVLALVRRPRIRRRQPRHGALSA